MTLVDVTWGCDVVVVGVMVETTGDMTIVVLVAVKNRGGDNVNRWTWRLHMHIGNNCRVEEAPQLEMKARLTSLPQIRGKLKFKAFLE